MQAVIFFLISFLISLGLTPVVKLLANRLGFVSMPKKDRWHKNPVPLMGGVSIYLAVIVTSLLIIKNLSFYSWLLAATIIFFVGIYDDIKKISPYSKLIIQILLSSLVVFSGVYFKFEGLLYFSIPLSILWIVGITNAFNLLDNIDGLSCGIAGISSLMLFLSSYFNDNYISSLALIFLIISGACFGFLYFNFNPAKIFMGDSGSMFLGFSLGVLSIMGTHKHVSNLLTTMVAPILILGVPIFDTIFVTLVRKFRGFKVFSGGIDHTSHRLVTLGFSEKKTVILLYLLSIIFGLVAISYAKFDMIIVSVFVLLSIIVLLFFGIFLAEQKSYNENEIDNERQKRFAQGKTVINTLLMHKRRIIEVIVDFLLICIAYYSAYLLRFDGIITEANLYLISISLPWIIIIKFTCFIYAGLYKGVWKYISISNLVSIFKAVFAGSILSIIFLTIFFRFKDYSRVVFIIDWLLTMFFIMGSRIALRAFKEYFVNIGLSGKRVILFGAGDGGELALREIRNNNDLGYVVVGFLDDDVKKKGSKIHGVPVLGTKNELEKIVKRLNIEELLITIPSAQELEFAQLLEKCNNLNIVCKKMSRVMEFEKWND